MSINERIKKLRIARGLSQEELSDLVGYTNRSIISKIENGVIDVTRTKIIKFAEVLKTTPLYLMGWENDNEQGGKANSRDIPLYSSIACGELSFVAEDIEEYISLPNSMLNSNEKYFCNYAEEDSMSGAGIDSGDLVIFVKASTLSQGEIGSFCINGEYTCKILNNVGGKIILNPANAKYNPIVLQEFDDFRILGKLHLIIKKRR